MTSESAQTDNTPGIPEVSDEEKAEAARVRAIETAEKRKDIMERHAKWEEEIDAAMKEQRKALRKVLVASRKVAAGKLKSSPTIRGEVDKLNTEAEKALKGLEAYFKKLAKESKGKDESVRLWDRVLLKVEDKYAERVSVVETMVNEWYMTVLNEELAEVSTLVHSEVVLFSNMTVSG